MNDDNGQDLIEYALVVALIALAAVAGLSSLSTQINTTFEKIDSTRGSHGRPAQPKSRLHGTKLAEILKKECEHLVEGQLLFEPRKTMKQGVPYLVFARLTRNLNVNIAKDIDSSEVKIEPAQVSCQVSMLLDGGNEFDVVKAPLNRPDQQFIQPSSFTEWDWHVTPKKSGTLQLSLYVTPYLYVENISEPMEKAFPQPPRTITVQADYVYTIKTFVVAYWGVLGVVLTAILIPVYRWGRNKVIDWKKASDESEEEKKPKGFLKDIPRDDP